MTKLYSTIITLVTNAAVIVVLMAAVKILPDSPFQSFINGSLFGSLGTYIKNINYFLPVSQTIALLEAWILCISEWYLWKFIYRISLSVSSAGTEIMSLK